MREEAVLALVTWVVAILLSMLPAFVLFKYLPSSGEVDGPLHGFRLKLGGAFAGFFAVFLSLLYVRPVETGHYHTYTVRGQLQFVHPETELPPNVNDVVVRFVPPSLGILNQGTFAFDLPVTEDRDGRLVYPSIQFDLRGYGGVTVPLRKGTTYGATVKTGHDDDARQIVLPNPIVMRSISSLPAYRPPTTPLTETGK